MWMAIWTARDSAFVYVSLQTCRKLSVLEADVHVLLLIVPIGTFYPLRSMAASAKMCLVRPSRRRGGNRN